ncbi:MAG: Lrp/AsnC family transcriptional regulator [Desulfobacterota bacterium]|nr:Lrp/AsnC family transcriptional regulator [Thermodesulfobacteriota bacterium]
MSALEKALIGELTGDLEIIPEPFFPLADRLGVTQRKVLGLTRRLKKEGTIRRFGATLRHRNSGFEANAMAVWRVPAARVEEVGRAIAAFREVTHCYQRRSQPDWPYNLYTMIHGPTVTHCRQVAREIARTVGVRQYRLLFSLRELKKTTMRYFFDG